MVPRPEHSLLPSPGNCCNNYTNITTRGWMGPNQATLDLFLVARESDHTPSLPLTQHVPGYLSDTPVPDIWSTCQCRTRTNYKSSWPPMFVLGAQPLVRVQGPERQSVRVTEWMNEEWFEKWMPEGVSMTELVHRECVLLKDWAGSDCSGRPGSPLHGISTSFPRVFASAQLFHYFHLSFRDSLTSFLEAPAPWLHSWTLQKKNSGQHWTLSAGGCMLPLSGTRRYYQLSPECGSYL